jgi:glycopeptide antibiotics resistance protein
VLPIDTVLFVAPVVVLAIVVWGRRRGAGWATIGARVLLAGAITMIVGLTIFPLWVDHLWWGTNRVRGFPTLVPLQKMQADIAEGLSARQARQIVGNVLLFVPLGFTLPLAVAWCRRAFVTVVIAAAASFAIEILQMILPFRDPDIDDVILNTIGAVIGYGLYALSARIARRYAPVASDLSAGR